MWNVAKTFGAVLDSVQDPFPTQHHGNGGMGADIHAALGYQADVAERMRQQQDPESPDGVAPDGEDAKAGDAALTEEAAKLLQSTAASAARQGPLVFAKRLADAATLNADQLGAVALVASDMQAAWEEQGCPERMKCTGSILRMLLLGGGGCGKTRIVNLVLTALFVEFWGPRGLVKAAPSNKAARGIKGKTLHAAAKLSNNPLDIKSLTCVQKVQGALACLWAPCGALIIDEAPQGAAALYHALALRSTYGRAAAHHLDISDYAEPGMSFGAMPVVVECGDELQLPPVPPSAGLFADLAEASTVHRAGVELFRQKDYAYRLATMKRFTDATLITVLGKMRKPGGCNLTSREWSALQDTDISKLSATEQRRRLEGIELWYQSGFTWATVAMAQVIRSRLSAEHSRATLYITRARLRTEPALQPATNQRLHRGATRPHPEHEYHGQTS